MNIIRMDFTDQRGFSLLYAAFTLILIAIAGAATVSVSASDLEITANAADLAKAEYESFAGLEWANWRLSRGEDPGTAEAALSALARTTVAPTAASTPSGAKVFAGGSFAITYDAATGLVTSVGKYGVATVTHSLYASLSGGEPPGWTVDIPEPDLELTPPDGGAGTSGSGPRVTGGCLIPPCGGNSDPGIDADFGIVEVDGLAAGIDTRPSVRPSVQHGAMNDDQVLVVGTVDGGTHEGTVGTGTTEWFGAENGVNGNVQTMTAPVENNAVSGTRVGGQGIRY